MRCAVCLKMKTRLIAREPSIGSMLPLLDWPSRSVNDGGVRVLGRPRSAECAPPACGNTG